MIGKLKLFFTGVICCVGLSTFAQSSIHPILLTDNFANRPAIVEQPFLWIEGSLSNATSEAGEPSIDGVSSGQTVWGTWTAPSNGIVTLSANADTFSPLLTVYTGGALQDLSLIASNNYLACYDDGLCGCHWRERNQITFHVASGQAYQICVDSAIITDASFDAQSRPVFISVTNTDGSIVTRYVLAPTLITNIPAGGNVQLGLQFTPAPKNDDFVNRIKLSGSRVVSTMSNAGATKEPGEPNHLGNPGGSSVWYSWTAPASGRITLSTNNVPAYSPPASSGGGYGVVDISVGNPGPPTCGNEVDQNPPPVFYPVFAAYTGSGVNSLAPANCLPVSLAAFPNAVEFDAVKGQTYQIALDGNMGTTGGIPFYLALTQPAANDNFVSRIPLHGIYAVATSYNAGATHQAGEPFFGGSAGKTVWWSWTAPVSGTVSIDLGGSDYSFPVAVFTGPTLAALQMVAADSGGASFTAIAGQTYQIAVGDFAGLTGAIALKLQAPIVELPLVRYIRNLFGNSQLFYAASAGQIILLQRSDDGTHWQNAQEADTFKNTISFAVRPPPTGNGPYYRAFVVDLSPGVHGGAHSFH